MHVHDIEEPAPLKGRFPRKCQVCMEQIAPGDVAVKLSSVGPKGGKHYRHNGCALGRENPRHIKKGKGKFKQTADSIADRKAYREMAATAMHFDFDPQLMAEAEMFRQPKRFKQVGNPFSNAGRRLRGQLGGSSVPNLYRGGKKVGQPRLAPLPKASSCDYSALSTGTYDKATKTFSGGLVEMAARGDEAAAAELSRRGRASTGHKLAWMKKAKTNPFGF